MAGNSSMWVDDRPMITEEDINDPDRPKGWTDNMWLAQKDRIKREKAEERARKAQQEEQERKAKEQQSVPQQPSNEADFAGTNQTQEEQPSVYRLQKEKEGVKAPNSGSSDDKTAPDKADANGDKKVDPKDRHPLVETLGRNYPIIQINSMQIVSDNIDYCEIEVKDILPTITLKCTFNKTQFLKIELPKDGDLVSVYMRPQNDFYEPLFCDFVIKQVITTDYSVRMVPHYKVLIKGELFVPNIRREGLQRSFPNSTSYEVLEQVASDFNLGFAVTDDEPTNDNQMWYQFGESPADFIQNVTEHAWKDEESFFDSWVDQNYNLTFSNQNKMLGTSSDMDGVMAIANQVVITSRSIHDKMLDKGNRQEDNPEEIPRLFTNLKDAQATNMFIDGYSVTSRSSEISEKYGHVINLSYNINNQELFKEGNGTIQVIDVEPAYNKDKIFDHVLLRGRSRDGYNNKNTTEDFVNYNQETIVKYVWAGNIQSMSEGDPTDTALGRHGNSYKEYVWAYYHNLINNLELQKIVVDLNLRGLNTAVLKGEKVAVLNVEYDKVGSMTNGPMPDKKTGMKEIAVIDMFYSGWFIVTGIKFIYDKDVQFDGIEDQHAGSFYKTVVSVSRREWVPPESVSPVSFDEDGNLIRKPYKSTQYEPLPPKQAPHTISSGGGGGYYGPLEKCPTIPRGQQMENAMTIMKFLTGKGLSAEQAAGMVGCFYAESNCNPKAFNAQEKAGRFKGSSANGAGYGAGIAQWSKGRKQSLKNLMSRTDSIENWDLNTQLDAVWKEITLGEKSRFLAVLKGKHSVWDATDVALRGYENGGNGELASEAQINKYRWCHGYAGAMNTRNGYAEQVYAEYNSRPIGKSTYANKSGKKKA